MFIFDYANIVKWLNENRCVLGEEMRECLARAHLDIMTVVVDDGGGFDGAQHTNSLFISFLVCSVMEIGWMVEACLMMCNSAPPAANPPTTGIS